MRWIANWPHWARAVTGVPYDWAVLLSDTSNTEDWMKSAACL